MPDCYLPDPRGPRAQRQRGNGSDGASGSDGSLNGTDASACNEAELRMERPREALASRGSLIKKKDERPDVPSDASLLAGQSANIGVIGVKSALGLAVVC